MIVTIGGETLLFDPTPKRFRRDLFDREGELDMLAKTSSPISALLGVRRVGKTSIARVFMNETEHPSVFIDCRKFSAVESKTEDFARELIRAFENVSRFERRFRNILKKLKEIEIFDVKVKLKDHDLKKGIVEVFEDINEWAGRNSLKFFVIFDEAQNLRFFRRRHGMKFDELFGYIYDSLENVRIILTGSEAGLLKEFLGLDDRDSPLYGRYINEITVPPFSYEKSLEFLRLGFEEAGMKPDPGILEEAVRELDGIVGWLVYFGKRCLDNGEISRSAIEEALKIAEDVVRGEIENLYAISPRYVEVLKAISVGYSSWGEIKEALEFLEKRRIPDPSLHRTLMRLENMGFIGKEFTENGKPIYRILDPIVKRVARKL